ncbi:MAG: TRAP transporter TatT component family protein [Polyangiales bacterium]
MSLISRVLNVRSTGVLVIGLMVATLPALLACDVTKVAANGSGNLFRRAAPGLEQHWDYDIAGAAMPSNIVQTEGLLRVVPENEQLVGNAIRLYTGYAYGWVEDRAEALRAEGRYLEAETQTLRARYMYERARDLGVHLIGLDHDGYDEHLAEGLESFTAWLQEEFDDEEDAGPLFQTGFSWGSYINANKSSMEAVADLPFAQALVERSVELDPTFYNYSGLTFLAVVNTSAPGADLDVALPMWERVLEITERRNLLILVNMAKSYAVKRQDRELFIALLREVLEAGDINPAQRLQNVIARRRAARYLRQIDTMIPPQAPAAAPAPAPAAPEPATSEENTPAAE